MKNALEIKCNDCGETFVFSKQQFPYSPIPFLCLACKRKRRIRKEEKAEYYRQRNKKERAKADATRFEDEIKNYSVVDASDIATNDDTTLLVLGNGFDLMHGVKSSYYHFRDSMGKSNALRQTLEEYLNAKDVWWDFEHALSRIDVKRMANSAAVEASMDFFDGYDPYESASGFFAAIDGVSEPMDIICSELPKRFKQWVNTLTWGTDDLPLKSMIGNPYVLCFNYTEFIETEYGVSHDRVCYIHGNRRNRKDELILGHLDGASDEMYDFKDIKAPGGENALIELAQEYAIGKIIDCDQSLAKHCGNIIEKNKSFFDRLEGITDIIVVGHSLADVDREYFQEIISHNRDQNQIQWYFSCYGLGDLRQINRFINELGIQREKVRVFRTDSLNVRFREIAVQSAKRARIERERILCGSSDGKWTVKAKGNKLSILNSEGNVSLLHMFHQSPSYAFFDESGQYLIVVLKSQLSGIYIYQIHEGSFHLIDELTSTGHPIISRRFRKVLQDHQHLVFVYNNRVMIYDLLTGELIQNENILRAKDMVFEGADITKRFTIPVY